MTFVHFFMPNMVPTDHKDDASCPCRPFRLAREEAERVCTVYEREILGAKYSCCDFFILDKLLALLAKNSEPYIPPKNMAYGRPYFGNSVSGT